MQGSYDYYTVKEKRQGRRDGRRARHDLRAPPGGRRRRLLAHRPLHVPVLHAESYRPAGHRVSVQAWVPIDDEFTMDWVMALPGSMDETRRASASNAVPVACAVAATARPARLRLAATERRHFAADVRRTAASVRRERTRRLANRPARAVHPRRLLRHPVRRPGPDGPGEHRRNLRPYTGAPGHDRRHDHKHAPPPDRRGKAYAMRQYVPPRIEQRASTDACGGAIVAKGVNGIKATKDVIFARPEGSCSGLDTVHQRFR